MTRAVATTPFHILAKPRGALCNLACHYCFYLEKENLYPASASFRMDDVVLEEYTRQYIAGQPEGVPEVNFAWQGGEPTLMGVHFFRRAVECQAKHARPGMQVLNSIQTNGTLLDDEWGEFLSENRFLVGLSIDGPEELHDPFRKDRGGKGSFARVMRGLEVLKKHDVSFNVLTCVQSKNADYPRAVYSFLVDIGARFLQFIPIVEPEASGGVSDRMVRPAQYGGFLCTVFDEWMGRSHAGRVFVRDFDVALSLTMGLPSPICVHAERCGRFVAMEHNGDLYSCDHYVDAEYRLGNITERSLVGMVDGPRQDRFGRDKRDRLPRYCMECEFLPLCNGGCPKDRIIAAPDGEAGLNYLCEGYRRFFRHTRPAFVEMATAIRSRYLTGWQPGGGDGSDGSGSSPGAPREPGRNQPCLCGSGTKFKRCCGR
jgi:uncharacterized protein